MEVVVMHQEDLLNSVNNRNSTSLTFRLDEDIITKLRAEAQKQGISLNSFVNHVLKSFLEWHIFEPKVGFVPILKPVVEQLFSKMTKEQIIEMAAKTGKDEVQNAVYFMKGNIDLNSFLSWFENRMKNSSIQVSHTFDRNSRIHTYVVKHDISENWSFYLKEIIEHIFNNVLQKRVEISLSSSMLAFKFEEELSDLDQIAE
ncbi:MAG TPA: toxin-antitoxin system HicB family antitoxin [Nitrososphaeraceae archaeon]|nr:toxin-antitoxin system HicB family antitoxin [Nitrososphaeraceae archaeon]